jgi:chromosomal replication initiation ATPase DnaA
VSTQSSNPNKPGRWEAEEEESPGPKRKSGIDAAVKKLGKYLKVEAPLVRGSDRSRAVSKARITIAYVIVRRFGYRLKDLAANFGREALTTGTLLARIGERLQTDLKRKLDIDRLIRKVRLWIPDTGPSTTVLIKSCYYAWKFE